MRLGYLAASPLLSLLFLRKIVRAGAGHPVCSAHVASSLGWMVLFLAGWGLGEAWCYLEALTGTAKR